jgi:hypothetical protein
MGGSCTGWQSGNSHTKTDEKRTGISLSRSAKTIVNACKNDFPEWPYPKTLESIVKLGILSTRKFRKCKKTHLFSLKMKHN